ncbi:MAG TPA: hypothetical protein VER11_18865 [Polyangiaceae bacterium]|nr:hypothetical protein [Polyangiaceae bacterium]
MTPSTSATLVDPSFCYPLRARSAVFAPVMLAALSLASLAHAQEAPSPAADTAPASATPAAPTTPETQAAPVTAPAPAPAPTTTTTTTVTTTTNAAPAVSATEPGAPARAKPSRIHEGFYLRLTSGPTVLTLNGHGPYGSSSLTGGGAGGMIAIGGAIVPGFVLAGTIQGSAINAKFNGGPFENATVSYRGKTRDASDRATGGFGMVGMLVDWYPEPKGGWHFGGSTGVGAIVLTNSADESDFGGVNFAGSLFGGYDWSLGRNWGLGLQLVVSGATKTKLMAEDDTDAHDTHDTGYRLTPISVGVQASVLYF